MGTIIEGIKFYTIPETATALRISQQTTNWLWLNCIANSLVLSSRSTCFLVYFKKVDSFVCPFICIKIGVLIVL